MHPGSLARKMLIEKGRPGDLPGFMRPVEVFQKPKMQLLNLTSQCEQL